MDTRHTPAHEPSQATRRCFLTICTHRRRRVFDSAHVVGRTLGEFLRFAQAHHIAVLAYCFMPDHLQLLVECLDRHADLTLFVKLAKQRTDHVYKQTSGQALWQEGYERRTLRDGENPRQLARYVFENPVRAGLVRHAIQYPHQGSAVWSIHDVLRTF